MKTFNIKALFNIPGCVVEKILVESVGVQVAMRRDGRCKPRCQDCMVTLREVREATVRRYERDVLRDVREIPRVAGVPVFHAPESPSQSRGRR